MTFSASVQESPRLPKKRTVARRITYIQSNRHLAPRSWPGGNEQFDDEDADDFENDGTDDLPGLENRSHGSF